MCLCRRCNCCNQAAACIAFAQEALARNEQVLPAAQSSLYLEIQAYFCFDVLNGCSDVHELCFVLL